MHVIATDGHDVEPETAQSIVISSGERYDVLVQTKPHSMKNYFIQLGDMEVKNRQDVQRNIDVIFYLCLRFFIYLQYRNFFSKLYCKIIVYIELLLVIDFGEALQKVYILNVYIS